MVSFKNLFSSNKSETLPAECSHNITALALSPAGNVAIAVDEGE